MPAVSKQQQKFMGIVRAIQKGDAKASDFSKDAQKVAKNMKKSDVRKYAATKHKGLPSKRETLEKRLEELIKKIDEKWSDKYKKSIDCNNPKGFSQRAHCQGKKKVSEATKYDKYDKEKKQFAKDDRKMKFGKFYDKAKEARDRLRPGEVKRYDKKLGKYVSNKD